jgi:hypothetical protein
MKRTAVLTALAATLVAAAPAQATTVKGSGYYQFFQAGHDPWGKLTVNAKSQAAGASGTVKLRIPGDIEPHLHYMDARVTCLRTSGQNVTITAKTTKVRDDNIRDYAYMIVRTTPGTAYFGTTKTPPAPCSTQQHRPFGPLMRGKGITVR